MVKVGKCVSYRYIFYNVWLWTGHIYSGGRKCSPFFPNCLIFILHNKVSPPADHQGFLTFVTLLLNKEKRAEHGEKRGGKCQREKRERQRSRGGVVTWDEIGGEERRKRDWDEGRRWSQLFLFTKKTRWDKTSGEDRRRKVRWKRMSGEVGRGVPSMSTSTVLLC